MEQASAHSSHRNNCPFLPGIKDEHGSIGLAVWLHTVPLHAVIQQASPLSAETAALNNM